MEAYRKTILARRNTLLVIAVLVAAFFAVMLIRGGIGKSHEEDFVLGYLLGGLTGFEAVMVFGIVGYTKALRDKAALQKAYIKDTDERNLYIQQKVGGTGFFSLILLLAVGTMVAGFFDLTVFWTLFGVLILVAFLIAGLKIYYHKKY